jgi:hypothetical protein
MKQSRQKAKERLPQTTAKAEFKAGNDVFSQYFSLLAACERIKI